MSKLGLWSAISGGVILIVALLYFCLFLNHTGINEIGIAYNSYDGTVTIQKQPGWYRTSALTKVAYVSTLPIKVEIPSEAKVIVTKIVSFNPDGVNEFIRLQGFSYSINSSLGNILLGYAFSGNNYPFLNILQETTVEQSGVLRPLETK